MDIKRINTIRELKEAGYKPKNIKEEIRGKPRVAAKIDDGLG